MALEVIDTIKPKNGKDFPIVEAEDVAMPDGSRLSEISTCYPIAEGSATIKPDTYYVFGEVSVLNLTLEEAADGKVHEYCFEFIPTAAFSELHVSPEVKWATPCTTTAGDVHQVSILRGVGVMIRA